MLSQLGHCLAVVVVQGIITVDGTEYEMNPRDGIYIGMGNKEIKFKSVDTEDPANSKKLTFSIEGDVMPGQSLTLSVGQKSAMYDYTVPNNAVREDKDGKFILVLEQKQSPLGTRYYAVRRSVEVVASDDRRSAITGDVYEYEYVVTTSTKPIQEGQQVRLKDN